MQQRPRHAEHPPPHSTNTPNTPPAASLPCSFVDTNMSLFFSSMLFFSVFLQSPSLYILFSPMVVFVLLFLIFLPACSFLFVSVHAGSLSLYPLECENGLHFLQKQLKYTLFPCIRLVKHANARHLFMYIPCTVYAISHSHRLSISV